MPAESSVIDEDDAVSILARYLGEDEYMVLSNYNRRRSYSEIFHLESMMHQISHGHPKELRVHPDCILRTLLLCGVSVALWASRLTRLP